MKLVVKDKGLLSRNLKGLSAKDRFQKYIYVPIAPPELSPDQRLEWALMTIRSDIDRNNGIYPYSSRIPNVQEVLRRAGYSPSYLEFKGQDATRDAAQAHRKERIRGELNSILGRRFAPRATEAVAANESEAIKTLKGDLHLAVLELDEARHEIEVLRGELADARAKLKSKGHLS